MEKEGKAWRQSPSPFPPRNFLSQFAILISRRQDLSPYLILFGCYADRANIYFIFFPSFLLPGFFLLSSFQRLI